MSIELYLNKKADLSEEFRSILIVDDNPDLCELLAQMITDEHPQVVAVTTISPKKALFLVERYYFDMLVSDIDMPVISGDEVILRVKELSPSTCTMAMTGLGVHTAYLAGRAQPDIFVEKNKGFKKLLTELKNGLKKSSGNLNNVERKMVSGKGALIAASLLHHNVQVPKEELAFIAGFSSFQRLRPHLEKFFTDIRRPLPLY